MREALVLVPTSSTRSRLQARLRAGGLRLAAHARPCSRLPSGRAGTPPGVGAVDIQPACLGLYCGKTLLFKNGSTEIYGECGVCPRGQRTNAQKYCQPCTESPELYDWLYLGFMAMLPLVLHWFFIEWYSGKKSTNACLSDYAFPYIILVLSLVTLAVYMSASEIENCYDLLVRKKRLIVLFSHWLLHAYGIISISRVDKLEQDLPLLALVPTPALFYLFTAKFTEPSRILSEGANGH
ncbi:PREDICTED: JNK1/MAPK8-associated membrane protein [Propithecus coquereli]|uniref:JNK1/MAPK8-associated membrane protein n=1 Tax=Propithecus coquereli TaxID=379532 RepID=UPI00063F5B2B|nr:PREDICTED: JNK1/MAPK8-associated membrane protein [Propithecus coquereli]